MLEKPQLLATRQHRNGMFIHLVILLEMLTGRSPKFQLASFDMDLVAWVRKAFKEEYPLSEIVDPSLLQEAYAKKEVLGVFHITLACVEMDPDL